MGLFSRLKKEEKNMIIYSCAKGQIVPMEQIPDEVFAKGIMGYCCGILPVDGNVYAPVDGTIELIADTRHAIGLKGDNGVELLLHIGINTVEMNGEGFCTKVQAGEKVKKGQLILSMDLDKIQNAGYKTDIITIITNGDEYSEICRTEAKQVSVGEKLMDIWK